MDQQIKVRNAKTGQECTFDTIEAAENFGENIADRVDWDVVSGAPVAPAAPAATNVNDLGFAAHTATSTTDLTSIIADAKAEAAAEPATLTDVIEPAPAADQPAA